MSIKKINNCTCRFWKNHKFDIKDYPGKFVMHVTSVEQAKIFCNYLHSLGKTWFSGTTYSERTNYEGPDTCYCFNSNKYDSINFYSANDYNILEFNDFDWSDFTMKKEFTKADLKNGDVVKCETGDVGIVCIDTGAIILKSGCLKLSMFDEHLIDKQRLIGGDYTILAVRRPYLPTQCQFSAFEQSMGELVYERKEVEEMTLEEVCKALGKEIKIVKK